MSHKKKVHYKNRNRHHLQPKSRNGDTSINNLLLIDIVRHQYWHKIFKNLDLNEVIELLIRVREAKAKQCSHQ